MDMDIRRLRDANIRWVDYVFVSAMIVHKQSVEEDVIRCCKRLDLTHAERTRFAAGLHGKEK